MVGLALGYGAEEHDGIEHPDHGDQDVDGPLQLSVLLAAGDTQGQGDCGGHDHQLPAPEGNGGQLVGDQPHLAGALHDVVGRGEQRGTAKGENHRIGVQGPQAAKGQPGQVEVQCRPGQLGGDEHTYQHADDAPDHRHDGKLAHHLVVVGGVFQCRVKLAHGSIPSQ